MDRLAAAVVEAIAFLELSGDDVLDADSAVAAMESIAAALGDSTLDERAAISSAVGRALQRERDGRNSRDAIEFYENFMDSMGLA